MEEMVAAAHPLEDLALVHDIQPGDKAQGELFFRAEAEAEEVMLEYGIDAEGKKTDKCRPKQDQIKVSHLEKRADSDL